MKPEYYKCIDDGGGRRALQLIKFIKLEILII